MAPLLLLSNMLTMVSRAETSSERILEVLDTEPAILPPAQPLNPTQMTGRVVFDRVSFHYLDLSDDEEHAAGFGHHQAKLNGDHGQVSNGSAPVSLPISSLPLHTNGASHNGSDGHNMNGLARLPGEPYEVLHQVSFTVEPGQRVALLGATGSGKSTLVNLISRFYDVTQGSISIDGVDLRDWELTDLRRQIGVVLQQTTLFSGTVHENIAYGRPQASFDEVQRAAQAAQAHDFILAMPEGYESRVEERGTNLSGGQKQRLAIARALLIEPTILILDDSTSALDLETEQRLQAALDQLMVGRTTFLVAQRINSVLNADQILVLDRGEIVARGTHRELLASSPIYQEIYHSQLGAVEA
jgi:ABC-type multidrug transport system fused ATPase/permease subunit